MSTPRDLAAQLNNKLDQIKHDLDEVKRGILARCSSCGEPAFPLYPLQSGPVCAGCYQPTTNKEVS